MSIYPRLRELVRTTLVLTVACGPAVVRRYMFTFFVTTCLLTIAYDLSLPSGQVDLASFVEWWRAPISWNLAVSISLFAVVFGIALREVFGFSVIPQLTRRED